MKAMEAEKGIRYFPVALFSSVMGVAGVALVLRLVENMYELSSIYSLIALILASLLFIVNGLIFLYRLFRYVADVREDFAHPVKMNFFGAISISLLLLARLFYDFSPMVSLVLWVSGAILQTALTLAVLSKVIWVHSFQIEQFNPAWFIPIVGNIVAPLAGVYHVHEVINWTFFSIGILYSIIYYTIFTNRIFFHPPMPAKLQPTFFILMAPPGIGFVSYVQLTDKLDVFAYILFGIAFYLGLLLLFQLKRFFTIPFFVSWWAYLFPSAAVTSATLHLYVATNWVGLKIVALVQVIGLIVLTLYLLWKTIGLVRSGVIFVKEV